jgi:hypothetical protein
LIRLTRRTRLAVLAASAILLASCSLSPSGSATSAPSGATPTSVPSTSPTVEPTPSVRSWTGLHWAVVAVDQGSCWDITSIVPWREGYIGVGSSRERSAGNCVPTSPVSPAFFTSADGLHWTLAQTDDPVPDASQGGIPERLVAVGDSLLAIDHPFSGAPKLWRTTDGVTWSPLDSPTWRDALATNTLTSVAAGPNGVVVVGAEGSSCCTAPQGLPMIIHSSDGLTWDRLDLSAVFDKAFLWDVTAYAGGYVVVGRVGEADVVGGGPAVGVPAAWTSADGVTWVVAEVEGAEAPGAVLSTVIAGADGLFATGRQTDTTELSGQGPLSGWASTDGRSWQLLGELGTDLPLATPYAGDFAGDGAHMVMLGRESCKTHDLSAWTSRDGFSWTRLAFSGETAYLGLIPGPVCNDDGTEDTLVGSPAVSYAVVVPGGVFVVTSSSAPVAPSYWFLTATTH